MRHENRKRPQSGFALLELILYLGMLSVILTAATLITVEFVTVKARTDLRTALVRDARFGVERLAYDIRRASSVNGGLSDLESDPAVLALDMPEPTESPTVFSVSDGVLYVTIGSSGPYSLTAGDAEVRGFTVDDVSNGPRSTALRIGLTVGRGDIAVDPERAAEFTFHTTVRMWSHDNFSPPSP